VRQPQLFSLFLTPNEEEYSPCTIIYNDNNIMHHRAQFFQERNLCKRARGESISKMFGAILFIGTQESPVISQLTRTKPTAEISLINVRPDSDLSELISIIASVV